MKIKVLVSVFLMAVGLGHAEPLNVDDGQLKGILERIFLDLHPIQDEVEGLLSDLNYASNRLVSVAKSVWLDPNTERRQKGRAMSIVSKYGLPKSEDFWACLCDGRPWMNAQYHWSGSENVTIDTPDAQTTAATLGGVSGFDYCRLDVATRWRLCELGRSASRHRAHERGRRGPNGGACFECESDDFLRLGLSLGW